MPQSPREKQRVIEPWPLFIAMRGFGDSLNNRWLAARLCLS